MSGKLDYAKVKRQYSGKRGEPIAPRDFENTGNWRVEYPEQFPVTVTRLGDEPRIPRQRGHRHRNRSAR